MWLLFILLIVLCYGLIKNFLGKKKNLPPSPSLPALPIIGHLYLMVKKPLHRNLAKLSNRYGPLLFLKVGSRRALLVSSLSLAEECLTKNDVTFANRPPRLFAGKYIGNNYTTMGWAPYGDHWRNLRKITSLELFSAYRVQMMSDIRGDEVRRMIVKLKNNYEAGTMDMRSLFFQVTMNVVMRMIAGKRYYGDDIEEEEEEEAREFRYLVEATFKSISGTYAGDYLPIFKLFDSTSKWMGTLQKRRDKFIQNLIDEKRASMKNSTNEDQKKKTMLEVILSLQQNEPDYYKDDMVIGLLMNTLAAAVDTSVVTMEWAMTFMINNPEVTKKAQKEIDNVVRYERLIEDSDLANLPYLQCVISETLRMCLPAPLLIPHHSSQECTVGGYRVPSNTMLLINVWAIQNDPENWEEPEKFKPERFEAANVVESARFKFLPFGSGRRRCPGEGLARHVMGLTLGSLIQCFDWERDGVMDMSEGPGLMITRAVPLHAKCLPRSAMANLLSQI